VREQNVCRHYESWKLEQQNDCERAANVIALKVKTMLDKRPLANISSRSLLRPLAGCGRTGQQCLSVLRDSHRCGTFIWSL